MAAPVPSATPFARACLVTGATGYLGGRLCRHLLENGWAVDALLRGEASRVDSLPEGVLPQQADPADPTALRAVLVGKRYDAVIHLAARVAPSHDDASFLPLVEANLLYGCRLLDAIAQTRTEEQPAPLFVAAGSYWEDGDPASPHPNSLYAASKTALRAYARHYAARRGVPSVFLTLYDLYGTGDRRGKFLAKVIAAMKKDAVIPATPGHQLVDLVHVDDVCAGIRHALALSLSGERKPETPASVHEWRLDTGRRLALHHAVQILCSLAGRLPPVEWGALPSPAHLVSQPRDLHPRLSGWEAAIPLETGLAGLLAEAGLPFTS